MRKALLPAFLLVLGSVIVGATVFREQVAHAASPFTNVIVGNTAASPVPVQEGNTDASGDLRVHEQGTANVAVTNEPTVDVASSATDPLSVRNVNDGQDPFSDYQIGSTNSGASVGLGFSAPPSGKTLVAETVSVQIKVPLGVGVTRASFGSYAFLAPTKIGSDGTDDYYAATQPLRAYISQNTSVGLNVDLTKSTTGFTTVEAELNGYLVPSS